MRLWHMLFAVGIIAVLLTLVREPLTRVFLIVFLTGIGEVAFGLGSTLALIQTVGAFGQARSFFDHAEAVVATGVVLFVGTILMTGWLFLGCWMVLSAV